MVGCLGYFSVTTTCLVSASLPNNNTPQNNPNHGVLRTRKTPVTTPRQQPSVAEVERAIGAGIFRDRDPKASGESSTLFDMLLSNTIGQPEGSVERKLRETGEWIIDTTEGTSRSAGQKILLVICLRILPVWLFLLLVASGVIKLPFSIPFLDDLIM